MTDARFYQLSPPISVQKLADIIGGCQVIGDAERLISACASLGNAMIDEVCFTDTFKVYPHSAHGSGACFCRYADGKNDNDIAIITDNPRIAFSKAARHLSHLRLIEPCDRLIHPEAVIHESAKIAPGAVIGAGAQIGENSYIAPNAVIGPGVTIGRDCYIGSNTSIICALLGDRVSISAGCRIGETGFGVAFDTSGALDIYHIGRVIIQDDVSLGANICIDRGMLDDTVIGEGSKIDNLSQIGHNVVIGRGVVIAAMAGISGSTKIGDNVIMGGRVSFADHLTVGDGARIYANGGSIHDIPAGETWGGFPAKPVKQWLREVAWLAKQSRRKTISPPSDNKT